VLPPLAHHLARQVKSAAGKPILPLMMGRFVSTSARLAMRSERSPHVLRHRLHVTQLLILTRHGDGVHRHTRVILQSW